MCLCNPFYQRLSKDRTKCIRHNIVDMGRAIGQIFSLWKHSYSCKPTFTSRFHCIIKQLISRNKYDGPLMNLDNQLHANYRKLSVNGRGNFAHAYWSEPACFNRVSVGWMWYFLIRIRNLWLNCSIVSIVYATKLKANLNLSHVCYEFHLEIDLYW